MVSSLLEKIARPPPHSHRLLKYVLQSSRSHTRRAPNTGPEPERVCGAEKIKWMKRERRCFPWAQSPSGLRARCVPSIVARDAHLPPPACPSGEPIERSNARPIESHARAHTERKRLP